MKTKNIQDVLAERVREIANRIVDDYFSTSPNYRGRNAMKILLTERLTHLVKEVEAGERERISQWAKQQRNTYYFDDITTEVIIYEDLVEALTPPTSDVIEK